MMARPLLFDSRSCWIFPCAHMTADSDLTMRKMPWHSKLVPISLQERGLLQNAVWSREQVRMDQKVARNPVYAGCATFRQPPLRQ